MQVRAIREAKSWRFNILVDGERWGYAEGNADRPPIFRFHDAAGRTIQKRDATDHLPSARAERLTAKLTEAEEPLAGAALLMIKAGQWKAPDVAKAEAAAKEADTRTARQQATRAKRTLWENKAREALKKMGVHYSDGDVQAIIDAMEWAQTQ